jgi:hypothetical protein
MTTAILTLLATKYTFLCIFTTFILYDWCTGLSNVTIFRFD